jgi:excisionase family DNA binding protein
MSEQLITAEELGKSLGVSAFTIGQWARKGKIPAIRITKKVIRFCSEDVLDALRAKQKTRPGSGTARVIRRALTVARKSEKRRLSRKAAHAN